MFLPKQCTARGPESLLRGVRPCVAGVRWSTSLALAKDDGLVKDIVELTSL